MEKLDIKKYEEQLNKKAAGLKKIHDCLGKTLKLRNYSFIKHAEHAANSFLKKNNLSWHDYHEEALRYIIAKVQQLYREENVKKEGIEQLILNFETIKNDK